MFRHLRRLPRPLALPLPLVLVLVVGFAVPPGAGCRRSVRPGARPAASAAPESALVLPWIEDDYAQALRRGRAQKKPLFLDAWAPWCHTCLSMRATVFRDPALAPLRDRFVWLSLDTDKEANRPVLARYPMEVWPTFFVIDPAAETAHGRWYGAASPAQLVRFLEDGERSVVAALDRAAPDPMLGRLVAADRAALGGRHAEAARLYADVLAAAPPDWPRRPDVLLARIRALAKAGDPTDCMTLGTERMDATGVSSTATDFAEVALGCADRMTAPDPRPQRLRRAAERRLAALAEDASAPLSADDRSDAFGLLEEVREKLGDPAGARQAAEKRLALLDAAAAAAPDPTAASAYALARAEANLALGRGEAAVAVLEKTERELPGDYNPPRHLARVFLRLGRYPEALAAADRALAKASSHMQPRILGLKSEALEKLGRLPEARAAAAAQVEALEALPAWQKSPRAEAAARERLAALGSAAAPVR